MDKPEEAPHLTAVSDNDPQLINKPAESYLTEEALKDYSVNPDTGEYEYPVTPPEATLAERIASLYFDTYDLVQVAGKSMPPKFEQKVRRLLRTESQRAVEAYHIKAWEAVVNAGNQSEAISALDKALEDYRNAR